MPIIKSAKKRVRVARKAAIRNSKTKRSLKSAVKSLHKAISSGDGKKVAAAHSKAQSELAKAGKKRVMHKNKVARKQSQLARAAKAVTKPVRQAQAKPATAKKPATKKSAAKKAPAKKPAAKK